MRLICPNCVAQYEIDDNVIPPEGRDVQCANCSHNWFQDSVQMFSYHSDLPSGTGDPDSDVPPELFNDLEGRLDNAALGARAQTAPNPNDMEPEEASDDFQIEQEPEMPSSRLDQDVLDVLRSEAEYSSGEKPPAVTQTVPEDTPAEEFTGDMQEILQEIPPQEEPPSAPPELKQEPIEQPEIPKEPESVDDLDEIRKRIMELEAEEDVTGQVNAPKEDMPREQEPEHAPIPADVYTDEPLETPEPVNPQNADSPFSRPSTSGARNVSVEPNAPESQPAQEQDIYARTGTPVYEENIPYEDHVPTSPSSPNQEMETAIETLVATQPGADRPRSKVKSRPFPNIAEADDTLYGASQDRHEARKDMLPDIDQLSSEIAQEAENGTKEVLDNAKPKKKSKGSFLKGFKYALLLCIIIGILYMLQPMIVEYVPQAEGFLNLIDKFVNMVAELIRSIAAQIQGIIG